MPAALLGVLLAPVAAATAGDADIDALRAELDAMRRQYEDLIRALESRVSDAEQAARVARQAAGAAALSLPMTAPSVLRAQGQASADAGSSAKRGGVFDAITSGSGFNPQISVILDGNHYQDDTKDGNGAELVGEADQAGGSAFHAHGDDAHAHGDGGHEHNAAQDGFNFREAELSFSATVDPYFDAATYIFSISARLDQPRPRQLGASAKFTSLQGRSGCVPMPLRTRCACSRNDW